MLVKGSALTKLYNPVVGSCPYGGFVMYSCSEYIVSQALCLSMTNTRTSSAVQTALTWVWEFLQGSADMHEIICIEMTLDVQDETLDTSTCLSSGMSSPMWQNQCWLLSSIAEHLFSIISKVSPRQEQSLFLGVPNIRTPPTCVNLWLMLSLRSG